MDDDRMLIRILPVVKNIRRLVLLCVTGAFSENGCQGSVLVDRMNSSFPVTPRKFGDFLCQQGGRVHVEDGAGNRAGVAAKMSSRFQATDNVSDD
ncbi:MAG: hypothetical protein CMJ81_09745 [Planctomycetaceae bacterium]|nr:hypothetical protein [Planctomycetaceae bacterium]